MSGINLGKYPGVSSFIDAYGKRRFRYRRKGRTKSIPGQPGEPRFEEVYAATIEGRAPRSAVIEKHPGQSLPRTLSAARRGLQGTVDWSVLSHKTRKYNAALLDEFLQSNVFSDSKNKWGDVPIAKIKRRHIKQILSERSTTPHKAKHLLTAIRKLIRYALDEEWIDFDPTYQIRWRPKYKGFRAWTVGELIAFQSEWPVGTTARTVFEIALWLGLRRSDIPALDWANIDIDQMRCIVDISKGEGARLTLRISPALAIALRAVPKRGAYVLMTQQGHQFSEKSLTNNMQKWSRRAGLASGCTIHGLRKTIGKLAAEGGATTRQSMELLGHTDIKHAELYSREAEKEKLASDALDRAVEAFNSSVIAFKKRAG